MFYKVSVIVPVYNVESYLSRCLDSLVNQSLEELEIIVVNDGSTDNCQSIIDDYKEKYSNIKSITKENGGLSDARNIGIQNASGEYLAFVDSDDWVDNNMMLELYQLGNKHKAEIVFCSLQNVNEKEEVFRKLPQLPQLPEKIDLNTDFTLFGEMSCFACNKIFKKELFTDIRFIKGMHFEDIATIPKLFLKANTIAKTNKYFYQYFVRTGSITRNYTRKGLDIYKAIELVKSDFKNSKYNNNSKDWKKFIIFQGFYSSLAYYAYVKDNETKKTMFSHLKNLLNEEGITKKDIINYNRFEKNYLTSLSLKKIIFYLLQIIKL